MNLTFEVKSPCGSSSLTLQNLVDGFSGWTTDNGNFSCGAAGVCTGNSDCDLSSFCSKPAGGCNSTGTCTPRPEVCITLYDPVCGCDGITYSNDCVAAISGVSVAHSGSCGVCTPGATQVCDTGLSGVCAAGTETCDITGSWGGCVQDTQAGAEVCDDSLDNDCDGDVDGADTDCAAPCTASIKPDEVNVAPGGDITLPIRIANAPNLVSSLGFEVTYDSSALTFTGSTRGDLTTGFDFFDANSTTPGTIVVGGFEAGSDNIAAGASGIVVNLNFTAEASCTGNQCIEITITGLVDNISTWQTCPGKVCCISCVPSTEVCDGVDNDCDGQTDENLTQTCDTGLYGVCADGTQACSGGSWNSCVQDNTQSDEVCDDLDNNCDGKVDEDVADCEKDIYIPYDQIGVEGNTLTVPVIINNAPNDVASYGVDVVFDNTKLSYQGCDITGTLVENFTQSGCSLAGDNQDKVRVGGFDVGDGFAAGTSGALVNINFNVVSCTSGENSLFELQYLIDHLAGWTSRDGSFVCSECAPDGDINGDGSTSPLDARMAYRHYMELTTLDDCQKSHADVNGDGSVSPLDARCIYRYYMALSSCLD
jgi:hypothetical protein